MATEKQQESRTQQSQSKQPSREGPEHKIDRNAPTQVAQVLESLTRFTRRLQLPPLPNQVPTHMATPSLDRIERLIEALGTPEHPEHANAVNNLVEIGSPALPYLIDVLNNSPSWLSAYRAAEVLGSIGDGRATNALIRALRHPNSNVRWNAVRALSLIGDLRAVIELRRVAHEDQGRTSWGESVGSTAQSALDHLRAKSVWGQSIELVKTAITSVLMILSLVLAFSVITALQNDLSRIGRTDVPENQDLVTVLPPEALTPEAGLVPTEDPLAPPPEPTETPIPTPTPLPITGTILSSANVRPGPSTQNQPIGFVSVGDEIQFLARNPEGDWYLIQLGENRSINSSIGNPDGTETGWVNRSLVSEPEGEMPVLEEGESLFTPVPVEEQTPTPELLQ